MNTVQQAVKRGHYYEEFEPGRSFRHHWGRTMTDFDAVWFSNLTTQLNPLYFNAEYAKAMGHPGMVVHPLWVACTFMGLAVEDLTELGGPFLGVDDLKVHRETYAGDTIYSETEVLDRRPTKSRPGWGIVHWKCRAFNQHDELVMDCERRNFVRILDPDKLPAEATAPTSGAGNATAASIESVTRPPLTEAHVPPSRARTADFGYFEDFSVGQVLEHHRGRTLTELDNYLLTLLSMNTAAGHVDDQALGQQPEGVFVQRRPINGWATVSIAFGLTSEDMSENAIADLGYDNVKIKSPMFHGDSIRARSEVLSLVDAEGNPHCGVLRYRMTAQKPDGTVVVEAERVVLLKRRSWQGLP
ncbi:MaoC family dehydratase [Mycolicibacterium sp. P9-64]|uniref:MaoC family dehydratase n=1 Tax=Mycolicibacterium sp. P9-64 TaxID=2024612 RepID=UPI001565527C|nr:MaoC family dehydratase [Mycolicibacterium sp. P9-64]